MDRITFDFEANEIIFDTDAQQGTEIDPHLKEKREAILKAAGLEKISAAEIIKELNTTMQEQGYEPIFAEPGES